MATSEGKPETKQEAKPEVEENQEPPLKYKAWVLKVSIHCEGCKRKVEKKLRKIDGVYEAYADLKQQKATVKANRKGKGNRRTKANKLPSDEANDNSNHGGEKEKETVKNEASVHQDDGAKSSENGAGSSKVAEGKQNVTHDQAKEPKPEVKQNVTPAAGNQSPGDEKKVGGGDGGGAGGESEAAPPTIGSHFKGQGPHGPIPISSPANHGPPHQHPMYEYPTYYNAPPMYLTSYNTAYPSSSYSTSYYTSPPLYSYAYMHPGHMSERPPPDPDMYSSYPSYSSRQSDSFEMFSDENPNACSIM
ncbi:40S ribosomal protein S21-2 [Hibiscus syriacus]|uniref:40S ribosomal protein S21-2 n=1 Tax=Hibiscus syriacus TaxID=106335 RepID=A0A6A2YX45_HIBSY|nr:40S ribosomal protein S21-2 [Hibiscus syriacus]